MILKELLGDEFEYTEENGYLVARVDKREWRLRIDESIKLSAQYGNGGWYDLINVPLDFFIKLSILVNEDQSK